MEAQHSWFKGSSARLNPNRQHGGVCVPSNNMEKYTANNLQDPEDKLKTEITLKNVLVLYLFRSFQYLPVRTEASTEYCILKI